MDTYAYIGTYSKRGSRGIYALGVSESGEMTVLDAYAAEDASFLLPSEKDRRLYAVQECDAIGERAGGGVNTFEILEGGALNLIASAFTDGALPCYLCTFQGHVIAANYAGGTWTAHPLSKEGAALPYARAIDHRGEGVSHPHCAQITPEGKYLCAVDCGQDTVGLYELGKEGFQLKSAVRTIKGYGPRHILFSADGRFAYLSCEAGARVLSYEYKAGALCPMQDLSTLPEGYKEKNYCSALCLTPDGAHLFVANRGHDSIACYAVDPADGHLSPREIVPLPGRWPRDIRVTPDGRFLLAALEHSDEVAIARIENGALRFLPQSAPIPSPAFICFTNLISR